MREYVTWMVSALRDGRALLVAAGILERVNLDDTPA
jgi:hypothetical protein